MRIKILRKDAREAKYMNNYDCPVARALKREGFKRPWVGGCSVSVHGGCFEFESSYDGSGTWNYEIMQQLASSKRSFRWLNIPGLRRSYAKSRLKGYNDK